MWEPAVLQELHLFLVLSPVPDKPRAAGSLWVNAEWSRDRKPGSLPNEFQPLQKGEARRGIFFRTVSLWQPLVLSPKRMFVCVCVCVCVFVYNSCPSLSVSPTFARFPHSAGSASQSWCLCASVGADTGAARSGLSCCVSETSQGKTEGRRPGTWGNLNTA